MCSTGRLPLLNVRRVLCMLFGLAIWDPRVPMSMRERGNTCDILLYMSTISCYVYTIIMTQKSPKMSPCNLQIVSCGLHSVVFIFLASGSFTSNLASSAVSQKDFSVSPGIQKMEPCNNHQKYCHGCNLTNFSKYLQESEVLAL